MKAVRYGADGPTLAESPDPVGDGVIIDIAFAGICGTDISAASNGAGLPVIPGHEMSGVDPEGRPVTVIPTAACGTCVHCLRGNVHYCDDALGRLHGLSGLDGGFAERVIVDPASVVPLPHGMPLDLAALCEPTAVAFHALQRLAPSVDGCLLVLGGGTVGLLAATVAHRRGYDVRVIARHEHQASALTALGVEVLDAHGSESFSHVLDSAGSHTALATAYERCEPGGTVASIGSSGWSAPNSEAGLVKEITLRPAMLYTAGEFRNAVRWLGQNQDVAEVAITHRFSLDQVDQAFAAATDRAGSGAIKVLLRP